MRRRDFIKVITGSAVVWPLAARAQQSKVARIGFLGLDSVSSHAARLAALRAGLRDRGITDHAMQSMAIRGFIAHNRESGVYTLTDSGRVTLTAILDDAEIGIAPK